ncbi:MAG TPA: beta-galactosidase family protein [Puia sp.]|nr:beta-galactosidase family protein [Puia sp.]
MAKYYFLSLLLACCLCAGAQERRGDGAAPGERRGKHSFALGDSTFLLDGKPFQMISGEIHYTRVPREAWRQRMRMARAMGLNTIGTYVFWNVHEPEKGVFDFGGNNDIAAFVRTAQEEGLWVVLRPSPYVCAEWEFGGYPYWLEKEPGLIVRSKEPKYLAEYRRYIHEVGRQLAPLQVNHGGNILMVQIENEYGSYGSDKDYLEVNRRLFVEAGFDGLLYTCDPAQDVARGHLPGLLPAVNGTDNPERVRRTVDANHGGRGPYYIAEWYPAWFDWWGTPHHTVAAPAYAGRLDTVLAAGISINMYMFHGGTTRGFMNGANYNDKKPYEPQISSYDYDAPLDEAGNATAKYWAFRSVIQRHLPPGVVLPKVPPAKPAVTVPDIRWVGESSLFHLLPAPEKSLAPLSFEDLSQAYGYVLYRTWIDVGRAGAGGRAGGNAGGGGGGKGGDVAAGGRGAVGAGAGVLRIPGLRDYGIVFVNGSRVGVLDRRLGQDSLNLSLPSGRIRLDILVENLGRINFGPYLLKNKKGIVGDVVWAGRPLKGWEQYRLPFRHPDKMEVKTADDPEGVPVLRRGVFSMEAPADTYLDMREWGKGCVWVNGHHLGRYWRIGPQQTIYVPAEWLKKGKNDIVVFELLKPGQRKLQGIDHPILNELQ